MNFYVISERDVAIAVVFHNSATGGFCFRAALDSINTAFNFICAKLSYRYVFEGDLMRIVPFSSLDVNWIKLVLANLCVKNWSLSETGEVLEDDIDSIVDARFSWIADNPKLFN